MVNVENPPAAGKFSPWDADTRVQVARAAFLFFGPSRLKEIAELAGAPYEKDMIHPWTVRHFMTFLRAVGYKDVNLPEVAKVLKAMERVSLLLSVGFDPETPISGQIYLGTRVSRLQQKDGGVLWLSEALGAELIIPAYAAVTVQITGYASSDDADQQWGTGLILGQSHVLTNRHVVEDMRKDITVVVPKREGAVEEHRSAHVVGLHDSLDVAVLEVESTPNGEGLAPLPGMVFRDPAWSDETFVFGYPRVPMTAEMALTVQRGEVVNPSTPSMPTRDPVFLYSATARPGNSGGPIVAGDGRVIGLVVEDSSDTQSSNGAPAALPFYRGIPSTEVLRALNALGFDGLAKLESWE
ncbi:S1 family peptidase [Nocardia nova]